MSRAIRIVAACGALAVIGALFLHLYSVSVHATLGDQSISQSRSISAWRLLGTDDILLCVLAADVLLGLLFERFVRERTVLIVPALSGVAATVLAAVHAARPPDIGASVAALRAQGARVSASSDVAVGGWLALGAAIVMTTALVFALLVDFRTRPRGARG